MDKKLNLLILKILMAFFTFFSLTGFTLDEDVLKACGAEHPNDFVGRFICNNRMDNDRRIKRELPSARACVKRAAEAIDVKRIHDFLNKNADETPESVVMSLKQELDFKASVGFSSEQGNASEKQKTKVIIFKNGGRCELDSHILFNINYDLEGRVWRLAAWQIFPEAKYYDSFLSGFQWLRKDHLSDIEIAKNEPKLEIKKVEERSATEPITGTIYFILLLSVVGGCIFSFFFLKRKVSGNETEQSTPLGQSTTINTCVEIGKNTAHDESLQKWTEKNEPVEMISTTYDKVMPFEKTDDSNVEKKLKTYILSPEERALASKFRIENTFVLIDVPPLLFKSFLSECVWFKEKTGAYPTIQSQQNILTDLL
jgi:hypothetical protein